MFKRLLSKLKNLFKNNNNEKIVLPPQDFFAKIKDRRQSVTRSMMLTLKHSLKAEIQQFLDNGQVESAEKLLFHLNCVDREQDVIDAGFTTFVYRDDLDMFITSVSHSVVKIIDLAHYERKIPEEQSDIIRKARPLFDEIYIVFTDYTGREERKVDKKEQAKDPIAFGAFKTKNNRIWNHRFYFLCDWTDEACDLTLDKYVSEMIAADYLEPVHVATTITVAELEERVKAARKPEKPSDDNSVFVHLADTEEDDT